LPPRSGNGAGGGGGPWFALCPLGQASDGFPADELFIGAQRRNATITTVITGTFRARPKLRVKVVEMSVICLVSFVQSVRRSKPFVGDMAAGHGMSCRIAAVPGWQPLERDGIWRVVLHGEVVVRVVRHATRQGSSWRWQLLQMDDMTDEQLDIYEAALSDPDAGAQGTEHLKRQA